MKQYEIIYLTLRANQLMGKYSKLMIPMTQLQEYAKETRFYEYVQQQKPKMSQDFGDTSYEDYAEIYFKSREVWQDGVAEFLDRKTTELSILERDYTLDPLDFNQLRDEFKEIYPKRYIPQSRKINHSWTHTYLQDEMKTLVGPKEFHMGSSREPIQHLGIYNVLRFNNFTYSELMGNHLSTEEYQQAYTLLELLLNQCIDQNSNQKSKLDLNAKIIDSSFYDPKLYPLLLTCISSVKHYQDLLSNHNYAGRNEVFNIPFANFVGYNFLFRLYDGQPNSGIAISRTLLKQNSIIETELYPKIYLIIRHYRLLARFPNAPIPTKFMDEYLEINNVDVNRDSYDYIMHYLFNHQDSFAEFLDNKFNQLILDK